MPNTARIVVLKLIQAGLLAAGLYMQYHSMEITNHATLMVSAGSLGGFLAVVVGMIGAAILQQPVPKRADILYNILGAAALSAAGYLAFDYFYVSENAGLMDKLVNSAKSGFSEETRKMGLAKSAGCFVIAFVLLVDVVATLRE
ncbi:uncharacterized protein LOC135941857 [Cloeon dipterum]